MVWTWNEDCETNHDDHHGSVLEVSDTLFGLMAANIGMDRHGKWWIQSISKGGSPGQIVIQNMVTRC